MKLSDKGLQSSIWSEKGFKVPSYDREALKKRTAENPVWVHFGAGNIFRGFPARLQQELIEKGLADKGIVVGEGFDFEIISDVYDRFDNLTLLVTLKADGSIDKTVVGSVTEAHPCDYQAEEDWKRFIEVFENPSLQMVSFTITEKGYALANAEGKYLPYVQADIDHGPDRATGAMAIVTSMLLERYKKGGTPLALVSMDNCSQNGSLLRSSVLTMTEEWLKRGYVDQGFADYVEDEDKVSFPWTMIDKITPRPNPVIAADLKALGVEDMEPVETSKRTYIAPFVNGEDPQYLVIEDHFPNGRPALEKGKGVYLGSRDTVNKSERMKVTALLNPVHSAVAPLGVLLGEEYFATLINHDPKLMKLAKMVAYDEGMPMVPDPGILSPKNFADELFQLRFVNEYLLDTNLRIVTDESQGLGVRFGETIKAYTAKYGSAERLTAIPLGIAGWLRYMLGVDDQGNSYTLAPDPMAEELTRAFQDIVIGKPETLKDQLKPILSNEKIFFTDLYKNGLGEKIEGFFREMIAGKGAVKATIYKYI